MSPHFLGIEEGESQVNGTDQIFNRILEENFHKLRKDRYKKHTASVRHGQERRCSWHTTLSIKSTKTASEKLQSCTGKTIRITVDFYGNLESQKSLEQSIPGCK